MSLGFLEKDEYFIAVILSSSPLSPTDFVSPHSLLGKQLSTQLSEVIGNA